MNAGIIVAGGKSERMGPNVDKAFLTLGAKPILAYSLAAFERCPDIDTVILVVRKDRVDAARGLVQIYGCSKVRKVVAGGAQRQESVWNGLSELGDEVTTVAVHDGARPCVTPELISETIKAAKRYGSGVAAVKVTDTVKEVEKGFKVSRTVDRAKLWLVQTPQTFRRDWLMEAFAAVRKKRATITDEASAMELAGKDVHLVPSLLSNVKVTCPEDLAIASAFLKL